MEYLSPVGFPHAGFSWNQFLYQYYSQNCSSSFLSFIKAIISSLDRGGCTKELCITIKITKTIKAGRI